MVRCKFCESLNDVESFFCKGCGRELKWSKISDLIVNQSDYSEIKSLNRFNQRKNNFFEKLRSLTKNEVLIYASLILNFSIILLFVHVSDLFSSPNNFVPIFFIVIILGPLTIIEYVNRTGRIIMFMVFLFLFEYSILYMNILLIGIMFFQIAIKGSNLVVYPNQEKLSLFKSEFNYSRLILFVMILLTPIQFIYFNQNVSNSSLSISLNILINTGLIIYLVISTLKAQPIRFSKKFSQALLFLILISSSFILSSQLLNQERKSNSYGLTSFSSNKNGINAYLVDKNINFEGKIFLQNSKTNEIYSSSVPACGYECSLKFVSNQSVLISYNDYTGQKSFYIPDTSNFDNYSLNHLYKLVDFASGQIKVNDFYGNYAFISNGTVWTILNSCCNVNSRMTFIPYNQIPTGYLYLQLPFNYNFAYFISPDMTKIGIIHNVYTNADWNVTLDYYKIISHPGSPSLTLDKISSSSYFEYTKPFYSFQWDSETGTVYYSVLNSNQYNNLYSFNFNSNKTKLIASNLPFAGHKYFINEKYSLLLDFDQKLSIYSLKDLNSSHSPLKMNLPYSSSNIFDIYDLRGIEEIGNNWQITTYSPNTLEPNYLMLAEQYNNENIINVLNLYSIINSNLTVFSLFICLIIISYKSFRYLKSKMINNSFSLFN